MNFYGITRSKFKNLLYRDHETVRANLSLLRRRLGDQQRQQLHEEEEETDRQLPVHNNQVRQDLILNRAPKTRVAESHHFYAAPALGKNFYAAPAPILLYSKAKILKRTKV
jgi:hypothetical protein